MRIAVGGIWTETNTFAPVPTTLESFRDYHYYAGADLHDAMSQTRTEVGGALDEAHAQRVDIVPLLFTAALPGGAIPRQDFDVMLRELTQLAVEADPFDALLLVLHGAMVVEGLPDPEAHLVGHLRNYLGDMPMAVTLDFHANASRALAQAVDYLTCYRTYPHVDMADRGAEAIAALARMVTEQRVPLKALIKVPLLTMPVAQETSRAPMVQLLERIDEARHAPGAWGASIMPGFAYADSNRLGLAVYVAGDSDPGQQARSLAQEAWERRDEFRFDLQTALQAAVEAQDEEGPVVLVDVVDNVGGGSPGDSTAVLHALRAAGETDSVSVIWDPQATRELHRHSHDTMHGWIGSHSAADMGGPFELQGSVTCMGSVQYRRSSNYMTGSTVDMGLVAVVKTDIGTVVLTEQRIVPFDDDHLRILGIEPKQRHLLVAKGAIAWKAAFGSYASYVHYVDGPGSCPVNLSALEYRNKPDVIYPLDPAPQRIFFEEGNDS